MARTSLLFVIGSTLVASALSFCCSNTGSFSCCGKGPCNIFCCNCDGGSCDRSCESEAKETAESWGMGKRNADNSELLEQSKRGLEEGKGDPTLSKFHFIDVNGDGVIDMEETKAYALMIELESETAKANSSENNRRKRLVSLIEEAFNEMDADGDGEIEQEEFDWSLKK